MKQIKRLFYILTVSSAPFFLDVVGVENRYEVRDIVFFIMSLSGIIVVFSIFYASWWNFIDDKSNLWDKSENANGLFRVNFFQQTLEFAKLTTLLALGCLLVSLIRYRLEHGLFLPLAISLGCWTTVVLVKRFFHARFTRAC